MVDSEEPSSTYDPLDPDRDPFRPPSISTLVGCLHCQEEYDSYRIEWRIETDEKGGRHGFWCCPIEGCDGRGFGFDILPVDPNWVDPDGREMGWCEDPPPDPETDFDRPPPDPTPVRCERCGKEYLSSDMTWQVDGFDDDGEPEYGWWACPTEGCNGEGFGIDVRPTDPNYVDPYDRRIWKPGEQPKPQTPIDEEDIPF